MAFHARAATPPPAEPLGLVKEDKWKLVSHLQKAVRRGLPDAAAWATEQLYGLDAAYLRYRLSVIAAEEVAGGSPEVVQAHLGEGWSKALTEAKGGQQHLTQVARAFAEAVKDRTPCTWMSCSHALPAFETQWGPWADLSPQAANDLAWDRTQPWWARGLAAWRAIGTVRFPSGWLPSVEGDWEAWQERVAQEGFGPIHQAALAAGGLQREAHPVFVALAWDAQREEQAVVQAFPVLDLGQVGPWLSSALDKHTSEGKRALQHVIRITPGGEAWCAAQGWDAATAQDHIGRLWFWMEGGQVDRGQHYPTAQRIEQFVRQQFLRDTHLDGRAFFAQWGANPERWHAARHAALHLPYPPDLTPARRPKC